jgi:hypothetical protein
LFKMEIRHSYQGRVVPRFKSESTWKVKLLNQRAFSEYLPLTALIVWPSLSATWGVPYLPGAMAGCQEAYAPR